MQFEDNKPKDRLDETEFEASLISGPETAAVGESPHDVEATAVPDVHAAKQPAWTGKVLGHFKLLRRVGEGRMGMVIQAQDINLHRIVALKVLNKRLPGVDEAQHVLQFLREARAAAQIEHPNVVRIYEINQHRGWWYIAMEMIEGGNLRSIVKAGGPLSIPRACSLIADAAAGLAIAHQSGIIHRDIKPTNLMLTRQGRCKLTDFGLVRIDDPNDPFDFTDRAVGSPQFMAPEMISRSSVTPAVDVYSLANTLYYAMVGEAPYTGLSTDDILNKHLTAAVPDIRQRLPDCPASLASLIMRAMSKVPTERPSAADMGITLRTEMVGYSVDESGTFGTTGSAPVMRPAATTVAGVVAAKPMGRLKFLMVTIAMTGILVAAIGASAFLMRSHHHRPLDPSVYFPDAPQTYGIVAPAFIPKPVEPSIGDRPGFSWVLKAGVHDFHFVASMSGQHYYPINSTDALLIRADSFVGYQTSADAAADGKMPVVSR
jgi:eukaryotic-like serine/threonine-protein kinase